MSEVKTTLPEDPYLELYDFLDDEGRTVDRYEYGLPIYGVKDEIIHRMKAKFTVTLKQEDLRDWQSENTELKKENDELKVAYKNIKGNLDGTFSQLTKFSDAAMQLQSENNELKKENERLKEALYAVADPDHPDWENVKATLVCTFLECGHTVKFSPDGKATCANHLLNTRQS